MNGQLRTFIAVELDEDIRIRLARSADALAAHGADVKWVAHDALHVTLKFLGDVRPTSLGDVTRAMAQAAAGAPPFTLEIAGIGFFPTPARPRVVAAGITPGGTAELTRLAGQLDDRFAAIGFGREERGFKAHVTLGRVRSPRGIKDLSDALLTAPGETVGVQDVDEIVLFMSELSRAGPTYTVLGRARLGGEHTS